MPGRFGPRLDRGLGLDRVDRPQRARKAGSYQTRERGGGQYGGTAYPTILEAYNRDSDYKRWRTGLDYWQGTGKSWADLERSYLIRSFQEHGAVPGPLLTTVTLFPSESSPDASWTVVNRRRGALVLPQPLRQQDISFDTSLQDPSQHRLILKVSETLSAHQLEHWVDFIGDQFEDSATGTTLPQGLLEDPIDTIAYTLVEVDIENGRLLFDLSRPYMRRRPNASVPRAFWQRILYVPSRPLTWRNDGSRYLCSSHRFTCSCPDYSGMRTANLVSGEGGSQDRFPRPTAGRTIDGRWEAEVVGYRSRFRDLSFRADQRRECKHIHAARWSVGYPYYEPSDYEIGVPERLFFTGRDTDPTDSAVMRYHSRRDLTLDRLAPALAEATGRLVDTRDTIPADEAAGVQPGRPSVLWTTTREPEPSRCKVDDWWLQRGTNILRVFNPILGRFVETNVIDGEARPMIELVEPDQLIPVEIDYEVTLTATVEAICGVNAPSPLGDGGVGYVSTLYWEGGYADGDSGIQSVTFAGVGAVDAQAPVGPASFRPEAVEAEVLVDAPMARGPGLASSVVLEASGAVSAGVATGGTGPTAPSFVAVGAEDAGTGSLSVAWPAHQANDVALLVVERGSIDSAPAISGWTELSGSPVIDVPGGPGSSLQVLWRRAASGSEAAVTVPDGGNHQVARIWTFRGCLVSGSPIDASTTDVKIVASQTATFPSLTTTQIATLVVGIASSPRDTPSDQFTGTPSNANLDSLTLRGQAQTNSGDGGGYAVITGIKRTAGATGTTTLSMVNSDSNAYVVLALSPV